MYMYMYYTVVLMNILVCTCATSPYRLDNHYFIQKKKQNKTKLILETNHKGRNKKR